MAATDGDLTFDLRIKGVQDAAMLSAAFLLALSQPAAPQVATPKGPWAIDFGDKYCMAARGFETPLGPVALRFQPYPLDDSLEIEVLLLSRNDFAHGTIHAAFGDEPFEEVNYTLPLLKSGQTLIRFDRNGERGSRMTIPSRVRLNFEKEGSLEFPIAGADKLRETIELCQRDLREAHGLPIEGNAGVAKSASLEPWRIFSADDYPKSAERQKQQGTTVIAYTINAKGRVEDCSIWESSGIDALDEASCKVIVSRYRSEPAENAAGEPVPQTRIIPISWRLSSR